MKLFPEFFIKKNFGDTFVRFISDRSLTYNSLISYKYEPNYLIIVTTKKDEISNKDNFKKGSTLQMLLPVY